MIMIDQRPIRKKNKNRKRLKFDTKKQYMFWWVGYPPMQRELNLIQVFMIKKRFSFGRNQGTHITFRKFLQDGTCIHVRLTKKKWGFSINIHKDIKIHKTVEHNKNTLQLLSELYIHLKEFYGNIFMLPRQESDFQAFIGRQNKG